MIIETFLVGLIFGFSFLMLITSLISYSRVRNLRLLFVSLAFLFFFIEGVILLLAVVIPDLWRNYGISWEYLLLHFLILIMLYLAVAKK